jgi:YVTN family beta-propeller protein
LAEDPRIGTQIAGYRIERRIGRGGMGLVYLAEHLHLQRMVALKLLAPEVAASEGFRERFMRESRMAASIHHPHIVTVYDAGEFDEMLYIVMQFVDGTDLDTVLQREGPLPADRALTIIAETGAALDAAHAHGLVHRDVKPGNILLDSERAYLTDFGLTRKTDSKSGFTKTGQFLGTIDYVSPEQIEGRDVDGRTDIYALGCVLYECLTADKPYTRDSDLAVIYAHLQSEAPRLSDRRADLAGLDGVIERALAKAKEDRWESCTAMIAAARAALGDGEPGPAAAPPPAPSPPSQPAGPPVVTRPAAAPETRAAEREAAGAEPRAAPTRAAEPTRAAAPPEEGRPAAPTAPLPHDAEGPPSAPTAPLPGGFQPEAGGPTAPLPAPPERARRLPLVPLAIAAGLIVAAAIAFALISGGGDGGGGGDDGGGDNPAGRVTATFPVETRPFGVAFAGESVYVVNQDSDSMSRLLPDGSGRTAVATGAGPFWAAVAGDGGVWITNRDADTVTRYDADLGSEEEFPVGDAPYWIVVRRGTVWVVNGDAETVTRLDETNGQPLGSPIPVGPAPRGIAIHNGSAWVTNGGDDTVTRIDEESGEVIGEAIPVGSHPVGISSGEGSVWVANEQDNSVSRIDAETGEPDPETIPVGKEPFDVAFDAGTLWVSNAADDTVTRIDAKTKRVVGEVDVGNQPTGITARDGVVWVALNDANAVQRIEP